MTRARIARVAGRAAAVAALLIGLASRAGAILPATSAPTAATTTAPARRAADADPPPVRPEPPPLLAIDGAFIHATLSTIAPESRRAALFGIGPGDGVDGQFAFVCAAGTPIAAGQVSAKPGDAPALSLDWIGAAPDAGFEVWIVKRDLLARIRPRMPERAALWARIESCSAPLGTARVALPAGSGLRAGDVLWVERGDVPIAVLSLSRPDGGIAAAKCERLVANAAPQPGDWARLAHGDAERRAGRLRSVVIRVGPHDGDQELLFPLDATDGAAPGDRFVVSDKSGPIGLMELTEFRPPFAIGVALRAVCRRAVQPGDELIRRPPADVRSGRIPLQLFRVEKDYALVNAGESDGMTRGQKLLLVRGGAPCATLAVAAVKSDFCGVRVERAFDETRPFEMRVGDSVHADLPRGWQQRLGVVEWRQAGDRLASVRLDDGRSAAPGAVVEIVTGSGRSLAGVVAESRHGHAALYLPVQPAPAVASAGDAVYMDADPAAAP
ncbi:MAG: hypothetical protein U1A27_04995 [Phycisphaerae bacterium]